MGAGVEEGTIVVGKTKRPKLPLGDGFFIAAAGAAVENRDKDAPTGDLEVIERMGADWRLATSFPREAIIMVMDGAGCCSFNLLTRQETR